MLTSKASSESVESELLGGCQAPQLVVLSAPIWSLENKRALWS